MSESTQTKLLSSVPAISSLAEGDKITVVTASGQTALVSLSDLLATVKVGGRNLLKGSNVEKANTNTVWIGDYYYAAGVQPEKDMDLTLTICYTLQGPGLRANLTAGDLYAPLVVSEKGSRLVRTFHIKQSVAVNRDYTRVGFYRLEGAPQNDEIAVHWAVLTYGKNVGVSDWYPSPEDLNGGGNFLIIRSKQGKHPNFKERRAAA